MDAKALEASQHKPESASNQQLAPQELKVNSSINDVDCSVETIPDHDQQASIESERDLSEISPKLMIPKKLVQISNEDNDEPDDDEFGAQKKIIDDLTTPDAGFILGSFQHSAGGGLKAKQLIDSMSGIVEYNREPVELKHNEGVDESEWSD